MNNYVLCCLGIALAASAGVSLTAHASDLPHQSEVAKRGAEVMPFSLKDTTHIFTRSDQGGTQCVVAKDASNTLQTRLVQQHLHEVEGGAESTYRTSDAKLIAALHRWFDAQLSDHGADTMQGHKHQHGDASKR